MDKNNIDLSKISWTDHTRNFWIGCEKISPACANCYAAVDSFARRERANGRELWGRLADRHRTTQDYWHKPLSWNKRDWVECASCGWRGDFKQTIAAGTVHVCPICEGDLQSARQRVFVSSLSDICEIHPQITDAMRAEIANIVMDCENLDWLFLTKRPENFNPLWLGLFGGHIPDWMWIGTTTENQLYADRRIHELVKINAQTLFLSCGPLLGDIEFTICEDEGDGPKDGAIFWNMLSGERYMMDGFEKPLASRKAISMVIVEGESGHKARPMDPAWVRNILKQCRLAGVPFHFKQWGEWTPYFEQKTPILVDNSGRTPMFRVGKKNAGRLLDGVMYNEFPYK